MEPVKQTPCPSAPPRRTPREMFIADTHFGHKHDLSRRRPQFASIEEMNALLIERINRRMTGADTLYVLGDFAFRSETDPREFLDALRPKLVLLLGNHDRDWLRHLTEEEKQHYFLRIERQMILRKNGIELHLNHYPLLSWDRSHYFGQTFSICGHIHANRDELVAARLFPLVTNQFNAGVDVNSFEPVTFEELVANNTAFYGRTYTEEEQRRLDEAIRRVMAPSGAI